MPQRKHNGLHYELVKTQEQALEAWQLVYKSYRRIGIIAEKPETYYHTPQAITNPTATICGRIGELCVSTISGYLDTKKHGLPLDSIYNSELNKLRQQDKNLIEVGMFADRRTEITRSMHALLDLIRYATYFGVTQNHPNAVIGVHPHHAPFYARGMGFNIIGPEKTYGSLQKAPVLLMHFDWNQAIQSESPRRGVRHCLDNPITAEWYTDRYQPSEKTLNQAA